jgi:hypothetical protein
VFRGIADLLDILDFGECVASIAAEISTDDVTSNREVTAIPAATIDQGL